MGLPIRLRLTAWYVAILAAVLITISVAAYLIARASLQESFEESLRDRGAVVLNLLTFDADGRPRLMLDPADRRLADSFYRLLDQSGTPITDNSSTFGPVAIDASVVTRALNGQPTTHTAPASLTRPALRMITVPIRSNSAVVGVLEIGESTDDVSETLDTLLVVLAVSVPFALVLASMGGWWVSGRGLAPVNRVTEAAREIANGDLSRRLNLKLPDDEVGRLARTFDEMISRLDATLQRQRQFTADASHELRTPLAAIRSQVEVALAQSRDGAEYRRTLEVVDEELVRMTHLVEAMLFAARSDSGALRLELETLPVGDLLEAVREQAEPLAKEKHLALRLESGPRAFVTVDEALLLRLMLNLVDNALRYTEDGSVRLGWQVKDGNVEIYVADTGPGIPQEEQTKVFEAFYRIDPARAHPGGAGLGLSICKWIAEAHGGMIRLQSDERGSEFTVVLPAAP